MCKPAAFTVERSQQDNAALEYILLGDLRDLLEEPMTNESRKWLLAILNALLNILRQEITNDQEGQYLCEVLEEYPNWSRQVDTLQQERLALFRQLRTFRDRVRRRAHFEQIAKRVRKELREWMKTLVAHKRHETRLLQMAFTLEIGVGD